MRALAVATISMMLFGCATQSDNEFTDEELAAYDKAVAEYQKYSAMPTPSSWGVGKKWVFIYVDDDEVVNHLIAEPTNESAVTYLSGNWKKLKVIFEQSPMKFEYFPEVVPAFKVEGGLLSILMAGNISHTESVDGRFEASGFVGSVGIHNPYCFDDSYCRNPPPPTKVFGVPLF